MKKEKGEGYQSDKEKVKFQRWMKMNKTDGEENRQQFMKGEVRKIGVAVGNKAVCRKLKLIPYKNVNSSAITSKITTKSELLL